MEGGWDEGGKSLSIWDTFVNDTTHIADGSDGKVACDSYHKYPEDVKLLKAMGLSHYRFSIAWTRIIPDGKTFFFEETSVSLGRRRCGHWSLTPCAFSGRSRRGQSGRS